ncbi:unnamed protein product [Onchocerca flexuosa]|uniref:YTH domain-containing protein n=1 Tax=Onchocerca flexuosa TaxID=387005 RepID=A0A183HDW9_9BILA|nr:unnamed protein product [Onchocerca flexuosa]
MLIRQPGKGNLAGTGTAIAPSTAMYSDSSGSYSYPLDNTQMMITPGNHETAIQDMSSSAVAATAYWNTSNLPQHNPYTQLISGSYNGTMLPMHSATDEDYARSLSVTASVAYPVPVSASTTPANGDVVEIGKLYDNDSNNPGVTVPPPMYSAHHSTTCYPQYFPSYVPPVSFRNY